MAKVERMKEKIILTAEENAILRNALNILTDIYNDCEDTDGNAFKYTADAQSELQYFFTDLSEDGTLTVEEPKNDCIIIRLKA